MSTLATYEDKIVSQLAAATLDGHALLAAVRGASGPVTPALRKALQRERLPAAFVVFLNEKLAPESPSAERGPRFAILLAGRALRLPSNPRTGDADVAGLFELIEQSRLALDHYEVVTGQQLIPLAQHMVESDERVAVAQITYIVRAV